MRRDRSSGIESQEGAVPKTQLSPQKDHGPLRLGLGLSPFRGGPVARHTFQGPSGKRQPLQGLIRGTVHRIVDRVKGIH